MDPQSGRRRLIPTNLAQFNAAIAAAVKELPPESVKVVQKKLAFDVLEGVVDLHPVASGWSRGNWHVTIGESSEETTAEIRSPDEVVTEALGALADLGNFDVVHIQNNVYYVRYLEDGTDKMPAYAMVQRTLDRIGGAREE